ncbi:putative glycoside hydrolase [Cohnella lupini]|uniref:DUF4015 domain-containing protein n=1 Tax=Cohnella lupini TaxID=1294267 RepID=A0A3D9HUG5_9BACL|nr:putative glycoside hydrolase [Cohnella lupini]RED53142.1 hypothetical protein DFP95_1262 [Cohnella lupini]
MVMYRSMGIIGTAALLFSTMCSLVGCGIDSRAELKKSQDQLTRKYAQQDADKRTMILQSQEKKNNEDVIPVSLMPVKKPVRAIYVSAHVANSGRMKELINLLNETELNAVVLDINSGVALSSPSRTGNKNDYSKLTISNKKSSQHFQQVIKQLKQKNIYLIARIVTFKNPTLVEAVPAWALKRKNGKLWRERNGTPWIDPFKQEAWEYPLALAEQAAKIGFDEVQYDYVRFPENAAKVDREVAYANSQGWTKEEAIRKFLHRATLRMHKYGVKVSADVFGIVGSSNDDLGIGQKWTSIAREVDVISPMIYPSHYSKGMWGIRNPDLSPGTIITHAIQDTIKQNKKLNEKGFATAKVRPWLQGFTAGWIHPHQKYGAQQIREQIVAARNAGITSYMIWNSSNRYPKFTT